jgi:hypothetical protein
MRTRYSMRSLGIPSRLRLCRMSGRETESNARYMSQLESAREERCSDAVSSALIISSTANSVPRPLTPPCWLLCRQPACFQYSCIRRTNIEHHVFRSASRSDRGLRSASDGSGILGMGTSQRIFYSSGNSRLSHIISKLLYIKLN